MEESLNEQFQEAKTDDQELEQELSKYDLDEQLEIQFNSIDSRFRRLEVKYQSLLNTRRFLNGSTK